MGLKVSDIYTGIQTHGKFRGYPTTFVNFTKLKDKSLRAKAVETIVYEITKMKNVHVVLQGYSPLEQDECISLIYDLVARNYHVIVSTPCNEVVQDTRTVRAFSYAVKVYCPTTQKDGLNTTSVLSKLSTRDEVIFEIDNIEDYVYAKNILKKTETKAEAIFLPVAGGLEAEIIRDWVIEDKPHRVKFETTT